MLSFCRCSPLSDLGLSGQVWTIPFKLSRIGDKLLVLSLIHSLSLNFGPVSSQLFKSLLATAFVMVFVARSMECTRTACTRYFLCCYPYSFFIIIIITIVVYVSIDRCLIVRTPNYCFGPYSFEAQWSAPKYKLCLLPKCVRYRLPAANRHQTSETRPNWSDRPIMSTRSVFFEFV